MGLDKESTSIIHNIKQAFVLVYNFIIVLFLEIFICVLNFYM